MTLSVPWVMEMCTGLVHKSIAHTHLLLNLLNRILLLEVIDAIIHLLTRQTEYSPASFIRKLLVPMIISGLDVIPDQ